MKNKSRSFAFVFLLPGLFISGDAGNHPFNSVQPRLNDIISCAPAPADDFYKDENGKFMRVLPGWGNYAYHVTTNNDSAQFYFNQGLTMYYSYHSAEAVASFKEAERFDGNMAMAVWGQALALGPRYNYSYGYKLPKTIQPVLSRLNEIQNSIAVPKEKDLINAMLSRYNMQDMADTARKALNGSYAGHMKALAEKYPEDMDIKALYADAVMLMHEWDFWFNNGAPKTWTPELVTLCQNILQNNPKHPGALHYYIHVTEASRHPEVALPGADVLKELLPGVAHMVHMASHEYERMGLYAKGVQANEKADDSRVLYDSLLKGMYNIVHIPHYLAVEAYCALSGAMYAKGMAKAYRCRDAMTPGYKELLDQYQYMMPFFALVRMGRWNEIISDTLPPSEEWPYASLLYNFAKGMAFARTGKPGPALQQLNLVREKAKDSILAQPFSPYTSTPREGAVIAGDILEAAIHYQQKEYEKCFAALKKAIAIEDGLVYIEPKSWMLPARQYLGAYLLKLGQPGKAEKIYREDLSWNPGNGWSLLGLHQSLQAQRKKKEAAKYKPLYLQSFSMADEIPPASVY